MAPEDISFADLVARYDGVLLDAYGVLVDGEGARPHAASALAHLRAASIPHWLVTNDASRLPTTWAARLANLGLPIDPSHILTSGALLARYFRDQDLQGATCLVLGPPDAEAYVRGAGGDVRPHAPDARYDVIVVADDDGYPFLPTIELALTAIVRQAERGEPPSLILPNPDLIYPKGPDSYGLTSGAVAALLELALERRLAHDAPRFARLGKPHRFVFDEAVQRAGSDRLVMVGDQLETDIAGARNAGLDAALLEAGITRWAPDRHDATPTYLLRSLEVQGAATRLRTE